VRHNLFSILKKSSFLVVSTTDITPSVFHETETFCLLIHSFIYLNQAARPVEHNKRRKTEHDRHTTTDDDDDDDGRINFNVA